MKIAGKKVLICAMIFAILSYACSDEKSRAYMSADQSDLNEMEEYFSIKLHKRAEVNLKDAEVLMSVDAPLELWKNLKLVCAYTNLLVEDNYGQKPWLDLYYLTDQEGHEKYKLCSSSEDIVVGFLGIKAIEFSDIDEDGLADIIILSNFEVNTEGRQKFIEPNIFFQKHGGFISNRALNIRLNFGEVGVTWENDRKENINMVIEDAKKIMQEDPYFKSVNDEEEKKLEN